MLGIMFLLYSSFMHLYEIVTLFGREMKGLDSHSILPSVRTPQPAAGMPSTSGDGGGSAAA